MQLDGRVVLVTGAARRVGRAIAERLADAGCTLAIHYRGSADDAAAAVQACRERGRAASEAFQADLSDPSAGPRLVEGVLERLGRLDALINNASEFRPMTLDRFSLEDWNRTLQVNLTAPLQLAHAARHALRKAGGRIINLGDAAVERPWSDHLAYMVSKGGLDTLTRVLARAFAPEVNVVGLAPGIAAWPDDYPDDLRQRLARRVPLGRAGNPEDIAAAVEFVLRDGDYITGAILPIDGGRHVAS
jgi:pteridine reductase